MIIDLATRTVTDLAVPYDRVAIRNGQRYRFTRGTVLWGEPGRVKLRAQHDPSTTLGKAVELTDTAEGVWVRLSVVPGKAGDRALWLAGLWRGLSIGLADDTVWDFRDDVYHCVRGVLVEISLTPTPAFTQKAAA